MRRTVTAVVALAVLALAPTACSSGVDELTASKRSAPRPAPSELAPDDGAGSIDEFDDVPGMDEFSDELDEFGGDVDDLFEQFSDELGVAGDCLDLLMKYAELISASVGMGTGSDPEAIISELRAAMPSDLHDELQIVADAFAQFEREGLGGAAVFTDPAFLEANDAIMSWLTTECGRATSTPGEGA